MLGLVYFAKGQIISKGLLVSSNSPQKGTNEFVFTTTTNLFICFLGEFEDTKKPFQNYLTFMTRCEIGIKSQKLTVCTVKSSQKEVLLPL